MRKYAFLKKPVNGICKIMLYAAEEGCYLFEYSSIDAVHCSQDLMYESLDLLYEDYAKLEQ